MNPVLTIGEEIALVAFVIWLAWVIFVSTGEPYEDNEEAPR